MRGIITVKGFNIGFGEFFKIFIFDIVFDIFCKQVDVYNKLVRFIVDCVLEGYNGSFIIYSMVGMLKFNKINCF